MCAILTQILGFAKVLIIMYNVVLMTQSTKISSGAKSGTFQIALVSVVGHHVSAGLRSGFDKRAYSYNLGTHVN